MPPAEERQPHAPKQQIPTDPNVNDEANNGTQGVMRDPHFECMLEVCVEVPEDIKDPAFVTRIATPMPSSVGRHDSQSEFQ